ncbi:hypothetical protein SmJEL517_g05829 [Synchytrium microbalum]|uniref:HCP-like protein n=1 Tax=Synchytrium microbalum TaxID=1806994 RepID=A0A507BTH0_9FUNG|nr:uncharacterized protein SmJEL517_g05829 [Synchytrium microbalum]TPX30638.1 hypothetical protein SmJEL517_g05829 [Synchytrium microbalum]
MNLLRIVLLHLRNTAWTRHLRHARTITTNQFGGIFKDINVDPSNLKKEPDVRDFLPSLSQYQSLYNKNEIKVNGTVAKQVVDLAVDSLNTPNPNLTSDLAKLCSPDDMGILGTVMCNISKVTRPVGLALFKAGTNLGGLECEFRYAMYLSRGTPEESKLAKHHMESLALKGYPKAQTWVGSAKLSTNASAGVELLRKAASKNDVDALMALGFMFKNGNKVPRNLKLAHEYLMKAHHLGNVEATYGLVLIYRDPDMKDMEKATIMCKQAATAGLAAAQHDYANMHLYGYYLPKSLWKAIEYFRMAATQGFTPSQLNLVKIFNVGYKVGDEEVKADLNEARRWLVAAEKGLSGSVRASEAMENDVRELRELFDGEVKKIAERQKDETCVVM